MSKNRNPTTRKDTSSKARFTKAKKEKVKPGTGVFEGIAYESYNELHFLYWVKELKSAGYIEHIERSPSYILTEGLSNFYTEQNKRKSTGTTKTQMLLRPSVYTPEFIITWNIHRYRDFVWLLGSGSKCDRNLVGKNENGKILTWIECKSRFDFQNLTRLFINNQKFIYRIHGIFVNLVKIPDFFQKTFTPNDYLKTSTGKPKKIKFETITLNQYITK